MTDIKRNDNDGARQTVVVINRLRARPASLEDAIATVNIAADEIDRLLTAINNAQSALTYEDLSAEERNHAARRRCISRTDNMRADTHDESPSISRASCDRPRTSCRRP